MTNNILQKGSNHQPDYVCSCNFPVKTHGFLPGLVGVSYGGPEWTQDVAVAAGPHDLSAGRADLHPVAPAHPARDPGPTDGDGRRLWLQVAPPGVRVTVPVYNKDGGCGIKYLNMKMITDGWY